VKKLKLNTETLRVLNQPAVSAKDDPDVARCSTGPLSDYEFTCICTVPFTG
jgi:hypothetical protein